jgi:predicted lipoprotein with Yx(FWY)xxD motif
MDTEPALLAGRGDSAPGQRPAPRVRVRLALRLAGGGLLIATGAIHLDPYLTGYRSIPTIGWLFLFQVIAAFLLGAAVLASAARLTAAAGAVFSLATLGGYLLSLWIGLFGFKEVRTTAGIAAGVVEVAAFAALAGLAAMPDERGRVGGRLLARLWSGVVGASIAVVSVVALAVLGASVAAAGGPATTATAAPGALKAVRIGGLTVLADANGRTLYWFAPDTAARSACYGSCAVYWPPVKGPATAGPGVTGKLSVLARSDGPDPFDGLTVNTVPPSSAHLTGSRL